MKNLVRTMILGVLNGPRWVLVWVLVGLMGANVIAPLFFWDALEAWVVLGTITCSAVLMTGLCARFGFTRILGLGHIFWFPLIAFILTRWGLHPIETPLGAWLRVIVVINGVSLVMDVTDVIRYIAGDRTPTTPSAAEGETVE